MHQCANDLLPGITESQRQNGKSRAAKVCCWKASSSNCGGVVTRQAELVNTKKINERLWLNFCDGVCKISRLRPLSHRAGEKVRTQSCLPIFASCMLCWGWPPSRVARTPMMWRISHMSSKRLMSAKTLHFVAILPAYKGTSRRDAILSFSWVSAVSPVRFRGDIIIHRFRLINEQGCTRYNRTRNVHELSLMSYIIIYSHHYNCSRWQSSLFKMTVIMTIM